MVKGTSNTVWASAHAAGGIQSSRIVIATVNARVKASAIWVITHLFYGDFRSKPVDFPSVNRRLRSIAPGRPGLKLF
jgi:hypothetical protein